MSRARGSKAQQRRLQHTLESTYENTIDFHQAVKRKFRPIELRPKTKNQENLVSALLDASIPIVIAVGPAGSGKSYLAMQAALRDLRAEQCERIVLTRPAVGVEDESHGFLPGDLTKKMEPWTRPLLDIMKEYYHHRDVLRMIEYETIEISPLAYMRGRTFKNAWIIADEMQNATPNQMKMLLTRIGEGSRIVVTGDIDQADRANDNNGLLDLAERLKESGVTDLKVCQLGNRDIQRHPVIDTVLKIYN